MGERESRIESKEKEPKINLEFVFGYHFSEKDAEILKEKIGRADIVGLEGVGWPKEFKSDWQKLANAEINVNDFLASYPTNCPEFQKVRVDFLYNTHKIVEIFDIPRDSSLFEKENQIWPLIGMSLNAFFGGQLEEAIEIRRKFLENYALISKKREDFIRKKIEQDLPEIIKNSPQLRDKNEIDISVILGAVHTRVFHELEPKPKFQVNRTLSVLPFVYPVFIGELLRKKMFFSDYKFSDREITFSFFEDLCCLYFEDNDWCRDSNSLSIVGRYLIDRMAKRVSVEELKNLSQELNRCARLRASVTRCIYKHFHGILPKTKEEFNEILKKAVSKYGESRAKNILKSID